MPWFPPTIADGTRRMVSGIRNRLFAGGGTATGSYGTVRVAGEATARTADYDLRDLMLANRVYLPVSRRGQLKTILKQLGKRCRPGREAMFEADNRITGYFNPVPQIVDCYSNVFLGRFGQDIKVDEKTPGGGDVNQAIIDPLFRIWNWTDINGNKTPVSQIAANQGTVGIRVVEQGGPQLSDRRIYFGFDHPRDIADVELDARGNVLNVLLEYTLFFSARLGENEQPVKVRELIGREEHSVTFDGTEQLDDDQRVNRLGVCPYVLLRHERAVGEAFGRHAYYGSEFPIHGINWALSQLDESVWQHLYPKWFLTGAGDAPRQIPLDELKAIYVKLAAGVPQPDAKAIVPSLDSASVLAFAVQCVDYLRERQPEMVLNNLKALAAISGETLAQSLKPAEAAVLKARANYEEAFIRASQIGLSLGIVNGMWNVGTGRGSADVADRAYGEGLEDFSFNVRPALPQTTYQRQQQALADTADQTAKFAAAKAAQAIGVSADEVLRQAGFDDEQIARIKAERSTQDVIPTTGL